MITVLAGGAGAARFLQGLVRAYDPSGITIISNVGDDAEFFGLHVSPDIDIVMYHLAGVADEERGFGLRGDTFHVLEALARFGYETWFRLGDADFATCVARTDLLKRGQTLSQATAEIAAAFLVPATIIPVTDAPLRTKVQTGAGLLDFQEFFVRRRTEERTHAIVFEGAEDARPAPGVLAAISGAQAVILTPSNPLVSIGPILAVPGIREALASTRAKVAAISPIVAGKTLKGPADRMMRDLGLEPSPLGVARLYQDFLSLMVIDEQDRDLAGTIRALGLEVLVTDTIMSSMERKVALARAVLEALGQT